MSQLRIEGKNVVEIISTKFHNVYVHIMDMDMNVK